MVCGPQGEVGDGGKVGGGKGVVGELTGELARGLGVREGGER